MVAASRKKIPLLLHPGQLALQAGEFLVPWRPGAAERHLALALDLPLPVGLQGVPNAQLSGHLGTAHSRLAGLLNRAALELRTELPARRHEHSSWPDSAFS